MLGWLLGSSTVASLKRIYPVIEWHALQLDSKFGKDMVVIKVPCVPGRLRLLADLRNKGNEIWLPLVGKAFAQHQSANIKLLAPLGGPFKYCGVEHDVVLAPFPEPRVPQSPPALLDGWRGNLHRDSMD